MMPHIAVPNWYPDPSGAPALRYWDGQQWTGHYAPAVPAVQPAAAAHAVVVNHGGSGGVNHGLHLILTVLTCGLWAPIWLILAACNPRRG